VFDRIQHVDNFLGIETRSYLSLCMPPDVPLSLIWQEKCYVPIKSKCMETVPKPPSPNEKFLDSLAIFLMEYSRKWRDDQNTPARNETHTVLESLSQNLIGSPSRLIHWADQDNEEHLCESELLHTSDGLSVLIPGRGDCNMGLSGRSPRERESKGRPECSRHSSPISVSIPTAPIHWRKHLAFSLR
jgi:hypothetical protein